ncbi:MAG: metallophosphoesterase [Mediterranea sp.]|jgi:predicted phosphodiesterase|nr:metallophosphoesterase [Mediterranea sp.]
MSIDFSTPCGTLHLFAFADTHGAHRSLQIPPDTDIVVFAGDACNDGDEVQLRDFFEWFAGQPGQYKLFVPGNHDLPFELMPTEAKKRLPNGIAYIDKGEVLLDGIRFYVLPARPWLHEPALIPPNTDVLVTHGAPKGILDEGKWGCPLLKKAVVKAGPMIHLFGHLHEQGGQTVRVGDTDFYNVSCAK